MSLNRSCTCEGFGVFSIYSIIGIITINDIDFSPQAYLTSNSILIAAIFCLLLWSVWLWAKMRYGPVAVNKLTLKTFKNAMLGLVVAVIGAGYSIYLYALLICQLECGFDIEDIIKSPAGLVMITILIFSLAAFWLFVTSLLIEHRIYWYFVTFQMRFPQNQLDQKKSQYQREEKRMYWYFKAGSYIAMAPLLLWGIAVNFVKKVHMLYGECIVTMWMMVLFSGLMFSTVNTGSLYLKALNKWQNFEYARHKW